jgi:hypothetical protein
MWATNHSRNSSSPAISGDISASILSKNSRRPHPSLMSRNR